MTADLTSALERLRDEMKQRARDEQVEWEAGAGPSRYFGMQIFQAITDRLTALLAQYPRETSKECVHGHTKRQVGCVSCVLVFDNVAEPRETAPTPPVTCGCGVPADVSHFCPAREHCWVGRVLVPTCGKRTHSGYVCTLEPEHSGVCQPLAAAASRGETTPPAAGQKLAAGETDRPQTWEIWRERSDGKRVRIRSGYRCSAAAGAVRTEIENSTHTEDNLLILSNQWAGTDETKE